MIGLPLELSHATESVEQSSIHLQKWISVGLCVVDNDAVQFVVNDFWPPIGLERKRIKVRRGAQL